MATAAPEPYRITAEQFLAIIWDDSDVKAELDNGVITMMAGGTEAHARIQRNIIIALGNKLSGSGCSPYGSDMGVRTHDLSLRYPDVSVLCGHDRPEDASATAFDDPRFVVEVLSPSTRNKDLNKKLPEYRLVDTLDAILIVDPESESLRLLSRTKARLWNDAEIDPDQDVPLTALGITLTRAEIFRR